MGQTHSGMQGDVPPLPGSVWLTTHWGLYLCTFMLIEVCSVSDDGGTEREIFSIWCFSTQLTPCIFLLSLSKGDFWQDTVLAWAMPVKASLKRLDQCSSQLIYFTCLALCKLGWLLLVLFLFAHLRRYGRWSLTVLQAPSLGFCCQLAMQETAASDTSKSRAARFYHHHLIVIILVILTFAWWLSFTFKCKAAEAYYSNCLKHAFFYPAVVNCWMLCFRNVFLWGLISKPSNDYILILLCMLH